MKNIQAKFLVMVLSLSVGIASASAPVAKTLTFKQKFMHALTALNLKSSKIWASFKNLFAKRAKEHTGIYTSEIIPLEVKRQQAAECGLCSIENGANVYNFLKNKETYTQQGSLETAASKGYSKTLYNKVMDTIGCMNDLSDEQIEYIATELVKLPRESFTVMQNIAQFNLEFLTNEQKAHIVNTVTTLRQNIGAKHIFILGNMSEIRNVNNNKHVGTYGHWTATVVERTAEGFAYYTMDSLNNTKAPSSVDDLKRLLEKHPLV